MASLLVLFAKTGDEAEFSALMNIPGTLINLCESSGKVKTLAEGSSFLIGSTNCRVLWPARDCLSSSKTISARKAREVAETFFEGLRAVAEPNGRPSEFTDVISSFVRGEGTNNQNDFSSLFDEENEGGVPLETWIE